MLKLIGVGLVVGGCTAWGFRRADELKLHVGLLEELVLAVQVLERELTLFRPPLATLLERMANGRITILSSMLNDCREAAEKGKCFTKLWEEQASKLPLDEKEKRLLYGLGQVLGRYDDKGQAQVAASIRAELEACAAQRRQDIRTKGRMYRTLGATFGGFLVLTLL